MEVWPNWAARWTQLQPSPSIKDGSAPYFISCTTIERWPCLRDERTKQISLTTYSFCSMFLHIHFKLQQLHWPTTEQNTSASWFWRGCFTIRLHKQVYGLCWNLSRQTQRSPAIAACVQEVLKVIGGVPGGGGASARELCSTCEPVSADAFCQSYQ